MIRFNHFIFFSFLFVFSSNIPAQKRQIDSLNLLSKNILLHDTVRSAVFLEWGRLLMYEKADSAVLLFTKSFKLAEKQKWDKGMANAQLNIGVCYHLQGEYTDALNHYFLSLQIREKIKTANPANIKNEKSIGTTLGNIGLIYAEQGDYPKALNFYFKALRLAEKIGDKLVTAYGYGNIANIYKEQNEFDRALDYYFKAIKLEEELGNKSDLAIDLGNTGIVFKRKGDFNKALEYYNKALRISEEIQSKRHVSNNLGNIGVLYEAIGDSLKARGNTDSAMKSSYPKALEYCFKSLAIDKELGNKPGIGKNLASIGSVLTAQKKYVEAERYLLQGLIICDSIGELDYVKQIEKMFSDLYSNSGKYELALEHYKKFIATRDSIFNAENTKKTVQQQMQYDFDKKESEAKAEQEKKDFRNEEDKKQQRIILWFTVGGLAVVVVVAVFILRSLQLNKKKNRIITLQKEMVEHQKHILEEKQKEILDSIYYARRIQRALVTSEKYINRVLRKLN